MVNRLKKSIDNSTNSSVDRVKAKILNEQFFITASLVDGSSA